MNRNYKTTFPSGSQSAYVAPTRTPPTSVSLTTNSAFNFSANSVTYFTPDGSTGAETGMTGFYQGGPPGYTVEGSEVILKCATGPTFVTNVINSSSNAETFDHPNSVASGSGNSQNISYTGYYSVNWIYDATTSRYIIVNKY